MPVNLCGTRIAYTDWKRATFISETKVSLITKILAFSQKEVGALRLKDRSHRKTQYVSVVNPLHS